MLPKFYLICFQSQLSQSQFATNIEQMTNEEVAEVYRKRWQIEVLWKFLKMHLKLDKLVNY